MKNELLKILEKEHRGKDRAIVSRKLEERLGCRGTLLRETVNELRCSGIPICSDNKNGYYLARTYEELAETVEQLKSRVSHNHRLSRWLAQPYKGMVLAGLKAHRKICQPQADSSYR